MTFREALRVLAERQENRILLGLSRVRGVLKRLGNPHKNLPCVHVAGTNGKGSTCAILESVLRAEGKRTGLYLSPHLESVRERIQVGGEMIPERDFARLLGRTLAADTKDELTYFELLTCVAFLHFQGSRVEVAVLETGLGGRLDATNVVPKPLACVISSIDFDHMQWLGRSLARIAAEKAGIIKRGVPVFCPTLPGAALSVVKRTAGALRAPLTVVDRPFLTRSVHWKMNRQVLSDGRRSFALSLLGSRQGGNAALAKAVLDRVSPVSAESWSRGLRRVRLPARFNVLTKHGKTAVVDGAHNPEAMGELARTLKGFRPGRVRWILGLMKDKDKGAVVGRMASMLTDAVATAPPGSRALPAAALADELRRQAPRASVQVEAEAAAAVRGWLCDPAAPRTAVVCGSFYLAAEALRIIGKAPGGGHA
ncbi:MAG: bifunctional folylpolyglutamate synthase/dihydrofolate synthase [Elusimicrobia bacterium]|nr:bifunctional folylpolyglutamate synthase/dihydrofolate synthase [Elusimicrobiota bacterium]